MSSPTSVALIGSRTGGNQAAAVPGIHLVRGRGRPLRRVLAPEPPELGVLVSPVAGGQSGGTPRHFV